MFAVLQSGAEAAGVAAEAIPQQQEMTMSLFSLFLKGGALMWVLLALSITAIYIFGKKWWVLRKACRIDKNFMRNIKEMLHEGRIKSARTLCRKTQSPIATLVETGIGKMDRTPADVQAAMENTGNTEVAKLERGLPGLASIAGGAPMIGFLGTVVGMVQAFFNMSQAGNNVDITLLSGGIYVAMITTVGGLIVGIIAYFGYNYLSAKVSDVVYLMDTTTIDFLDIMMNRPDATAKADKPAAKPE